MRECGLPPAHRPYAMGWDTEKDHLGNTIFLENRSLRDWGDRGP